MAYVPPHLRGAGRGGAAPSRPDPSSAQGAATQAREGRAAALGGAGSGDRWGGGSGGWGGGSRGGGGWGGGRSREDRSYEYRADAGAPLTHPTDEQGGVGECFGTVVRREAAEHPPLQPAELEAVAAAAAALPTATGEEDGEEGEDERGTAEEPFFDAFLTAAVATDGTDFFSQLASSKQRLARQDDRVWQMRDTPKVSFIGQFYNCMREVDRATGGYFSGPPTALPKPEPEPEPQPSMTACNGVQSVGCPHCGALLPVGEAASHRCPAAPDAAAPQPQPEPERPNRFALGGRSGPTTTAASGPTHAVETFLDIGCAPGGFAQFLLDHSQRWRGMGLTLAEGGHLMDKRFMSDVERDTAGRFKLIFGDVTDTPHDMLFAPDGARLPAGSAPQFDLVIAGARSSKSENSKGTFSRAAVKILLSAQ